MGKNPVRFAARTHGVNWTHRISVSYLSVSIRICKGGGGIERDLFDAEHEGFLTDSKLLETLVTEKL